MTVKEKPTTVESRWRHPCGCVLEVMGGLECIVLKISGRHYTGYVGVREGHPLYKYNSDRRLDELLNVHGGVTYDGVMHGEDQDIWWIGFDCGHSGDGEGNVIIDKLGKYVEYKWISKRPLSYVIAETTSLAKQIHDYAIEKWTYLK